MDVLVRLDDGSYANIEIFICLDSFHSIVHNITKSSTLQDAWLTFLSSVDINEISELVRNFPMFLPIYQEIAEFAQKPEELMSMFSEALYIMDRNMERLMVEEMKEEVEATKAEVEAARTEVEIFRQRLTGSSPAEIADSLCITLDEVNNVLSSVSR